MNIENITVITLILIPVLQMTVSMLVIHQIGIIEILDQHVPCTYQIFPISPLESIFPSIKQCLHMTFL